MRQISVRGPIVSDDDKWIYDWFEMACTTPGEFIGALQEADGDDIQVIINSVGGYVTQAAEIYEAIRSYKGNITGKVIGQACSCASFIACAMYCEISPIGEIFIHNCSGGVEGDYRAMQQAKDALLQTNDNIILAYQEKTGLPKEQLQRMMDKNTTLSAREAVEMGFVDKISENSNYESKIDDYGMVASAVSGMLPISNLSEQKRAVLAAVAQGLPLQVGVNNFTKKKEDSMGKLSDFLASNPDAKSEYQALIESEKKNAREEGVNEERARLEAIDQIASNIAVDAVNDAKYSNPVNAEELALSALKNGMFRQRESSGTENPDAPKENNTAVENSKDGIISKMAQDYAESNVKDLQSPATNPMSGVKAGNHVDDMSAKMADAITKYL